MPIWKLKLTGEARHDFKKLDGSQKILVAKQSEANKMRLLGAVENVEKGENLVQT
ncbi:MAG TPA: hypothetical protein VEF34_14175 [Syntrophobacteraceae bacterium]|nr:hypothetical protein [Syntrophobacteraceae bacterium]